MGGAEGAADMLPAALLVLEPLLPPALGLELENEVYAPALALPALWSARPFPPPGTARNTVCCEVLLLLDAVLL
jgi:hypothetical protein